MAVFYCSIWDYETRTIMTDWYDYTVPDSTTWGYFYDKFGYDRSYFMAGEFTNPDGEEGSFGRLTGTIFGNALIQGDYSVRFYITIEDPTIDYYYSIYRVLQNSSYSGSPTLYSSAQAYPATSAPSVSANDFSVTTPTGYYRRGISKNSNLGSGSVSASVSITSTSSSSPTKIYYYYYPNSYSVIYNANNGTGTTSSTARYYNEAYTLATSGFSRTGYNFAGWKLNNAGTTYAAGATVPATTTTGNLTYYAQWSAASYTVKYNLNGATGTINSTTRYYNTSYTLTSTHPRWTGHNFLGWRLNNSGTLYQPGATIAASTSTSTLEYYAQWEIKTHTITYDANGGSGAPSQTTQNYDTYHTVTSIVPSRQGYKFLGWSENSSDVEPTYYAGNSIIIEKDLILYAIWTKAKDPFYWTGSSSISLQQGELISNYINSTKINEFQTKIKNEINSSYSPSNVTSTTLITKTLYNALAAILNISQISSNEKITAQHWINLQDAYNNYD